METIKSIFTGIKLSLRNQLYLIIIGTFFMFVKLVAPIVISNLIDFIKNANLNLGIINYIVKEYKQLTELFVSISSLSLYFTLFLLMLMFLIKLVTRERVRFNGYLEIVEFIYVKFGITFTCFYIYAYQIKYIVNNTLKLQLYKPDDALLDIGFHTNFAMVILLLSGMIIHRNNGNTSQSTNQ